MQREALGHVEDPAGPRNLVHDGRWESRGGFGDGGRGVAEMTPGLLGEMRKDHSGRWQRRALAPAVRLPEREHFDHRTKIGNPRRHVGRWEERACFGDGRPFHGPLKEAPGPPVDPAVESGSHRSKEPPPGLIPAGGWEARAYFGDGGRRGGELDVDAWDHRPGGALHVGRWEARATGDTYRRPPLVKEGRGKGGKGKGGREDRPGEEPPAEGDGEKPVTAAEPSEVDRSTGERVRPVRARPPPGGWIDPGDVHAGRWEDRAGWGDGGRAEDRAADVARGAAYRFPEEVIHAGRWERRGEWAHDRTVAKNEAWRAHRAARREAAEEEATDPFRGPPVGFVGFDVAREPVRVPSFVSDARRRTAGNGRKETEVTRPERVPLAEQKATLMRTARVSPSAAARLERRRVAAAAAERPSLRRDGRPTSGPHHRRATDLTDAKLAAARHVADGDAFLGANFGEGDVVSPGDVAEAIPGYFHRRGSDVTAGSGGAENGRHVSGGAGVASCMGWSETRIGEMAKRRPAGKKERAGIEARVEAAGWGERGGGLNDGAAAWDVFIHQPQGPPRGGAEPRVYHKFVAGGWVNEVVRGGPDTSSPAGKDEDGEGGAPPAEIVPAEIEHLMNDTRRQKWREEKKNAKQKELAAIDQRMKLGRTAGRVHSDWKAPGAAAKAEAMNARDGTSKR